MFQYTYETYKYESAERQEKARRQQVAKDSKRK